MTAIDVPLVLASASPRRAELLARAGFVFDVAPAAVDERRRRDEPPAVYVTRLARAKVDAVAVDHPGRVVVGADTIVVVDDVVLGKPIDARDAKSMLRRLSGRVHEVLTGVAVRRHETYLTAVETTRVTLATLDDADVDWYIRTGEPADKAGAYGAQGIASRFITRVDGSYTNVVGLPMASLEQLLRDLLQISANASAGGDEQARPASWSN